ncbi:MAG: hypothetical protein ABI614_22010, partial [Planctomycetota bacterium]
GRSAQAATLCALLAATGNPYGELDRAHSEQPRAVDPLDLQVAISATVDRNSDAKNPIERQLGPVTSIPKKLSSAAGPLDTFVFQKDQPDDSEQQIAQLDKERAEQEKRALPYMGLHIERAETVAEALDLLLVTNRHLRKYQKIVRHEWLKQWEDGTARFPDDTRDGPDRQNRPEVLETVED